MTLEQYVAAGVRNAYHDDEIPCAPATLRILGELFGIDLGEQLLQASWGLNGAGQHGEQCGLVEGALMFISLLAHRRGMTKDELYLSCREYAEAYAEQFRSLLCRDLRPGGFNDSDPPHLCERLSADAIVFAARFVACRFDLEPGTALDRQP